MEDVVFWKKKMFCFHGDVFASLKCSHVTLPVEFGSCYPLCSPHKLLHYTHAVCWFWSGSAAAGAPWQGLPCRAVCTLGSVSLGFPGRVCPAEQCAVWVLSDQGWWVFRRTLGCCLVWDFCTEAFVLTVHSWWLLWRAECCWVSVHLGISIWHSVPLFQLLFRHWILL